ncbi:hypothetical protein [Kitasatospora sp. NPDC086791]|uniref:hypothetical protein n=1 Tax=Kitasatospora sp. NPDC086791 TaxID=3155178 RepID=UPI0034220984
MNTTALVQRPKQPTGACRAATTTADHDHPAGEVRLRTGGGLGRRSQLLRGPSAFRMTSVWTTISRALGDEPR